MTAQQLKNSILQLAVQGKLVPQDPNDEPASVLLERIHKEKEKLIKEGKIKREKNPSVIFRGADNTPYEKVGNAEPVSIADEVPFDIPDSWEWVRFKDLVSYSMGKTPPRKEFEYWENATLPWVSIADLVSDGIVHSTKENINEYAADHIFKRKLSKAGTLLMSFKLTVGKVSILGIDAYHNEAIISVYPFIDTDKIVTNYLFATLPLLSQAGDTKTAIKGNTLNSDSLDALLIPLPSLTEQRRIYNKLLELVVPLENYNSVETAITQLNTAFPDKLKKSILQMAVQGKLVPQDENDEPASVLLERIRAEKEKLIAAGKIKRDKPESVIFRRDNSHYEKLGSEERCIDDEIPFEIPDSWEWVRLGSIGETNIGLTYKPSDKTDSSGILVLRSSNIQDGFMDYSDCVFVSCIVPERAMINKDDILICARNGSRSLVGKCAIVDRNGMAFGAFMAKYSSEFNPYIKVFLDSPVFRGQLDGVKTETINQITQDMLKNQLIPLPPLEEQRRIVAQIEAILPLLNGV